LTNKKENLWIFSFEYAGIAKVGGLGEVPANQVKYLKDDYSITIFIPSHGQIERLKKIYDLEKLSFSYKTTINLSQFGVFEKKFSCEITFYKCNINDINIILLSGGNSLTSKYLDDSTVYNPETFSGKLLLFSLGMRFYIHYLISNDRFAIPNLIHMHDYHVVIPFIGIKQELIRIGLNIPSIITIHLLTWPRYNIDYYYACGIDNTPIKILLKEGIKSFSIQEIFDLCEESRKENNEYKPPTVEKIGAIISDLVTTVSKSYLFSDIIPNLGQNLIEFKSDFVWDGCDWDYQEIYNNVLQKLGKEICEIFNLTDDTEITRNHMKDYLLTYKISHLSESPLINSKKVLEIINEISNGNPFIRNGNILAFDESGPLIIATGRISRQKGFETIFEAIPEVIKIIPNAKFLFLILPTEYSLKEIKEYAQFVKKYPKNLRIIFGVAAEIFQIAHITANAYCALSRWEPFGIIALEAMASKLPVIATKVGGLQETIIDIRNDPKNGTGLLIEKDNPSQFSNALISLIKIAEISYLDDDSKVIKFAKDIPDLNLKDFVLSDKNLYNKIKENCYRRVNESFRWQKVTQKLKVLYKSII
jgi:starch synthase